MEAQMQKCAFLIEHEQFHTDKDEPDEAAVGGEKKQKRRRKRRRRQLDECKVLAEGLLAGEGGEDEVASMARQWLAQEGNR